VVFDYFMSTHNDGKWLKANLVASGSKCILGYTQKYWLHCYL